MLTPGYADSNEGAWIPSEEVRLQGVCASPLRWNLRDATFLIFPKTVAVPAPVSVPW